MADDVLQVRDLRVRLSLPAGAIMPVDGVSFSVGAGRTLALVGESGSGKSLTCLSMLRVLPPGASIVGGTVKLRGEDLLTKTEAEMAAIRGRHVGMVLQDPMTALNPLMTTGRQIGEMFRYHANMPRRRDWWRAAIGAMRAVHIPAPEQRARSYPHQFSGGMRQRVAIAMGVACQPSLLIADEPTTALDVTIRMQVLRLLREMQAETGMAVVLVTHDLHLVSHFCDDVAVMYGGRIVEQGPVGAVFDAPLHPYTAALLAAVPRVTSRPQRLAVIEGQPPRLDDLGAGCRFAPRCALAVRCCHDSYPVTETVGPARVVACWQAMRAAA